jgi:hypothetical protein
MDEITISPSAGQHGVLDSLFYHFWKGTSGDGLADRRCLLPPSQQRRSQQVWQVNPGSKGDGLPRGILTLSDTQTIVFSKEASHNKVFRKPHRSDHCLETAPGAQHSLLQRGDAVGTRIVVIGGVIYGQG